MVFDKMLRLYKLFSKDVSKRLLLPPLMLLDVLNLTSVPKKTTSIKLSFFIIMFMVLVLETTQVIYLIMNISDIKVVATAMYTISTTFQVDKTITSNLFIFMNVFDF